MNTIVVSGDRSGGFNTALASRIRDLIPGAVYIGIGRGIKERDREGAFYPTGTPFSEIESANASASFLIIESDGALEEIFPDLSIFLEAGYRTPPASGARRGADIVCGGRVDQARLAALGARLDLDPSVVRKIAWLSGARPEPVTGIILAGGQSGRMGTDKAMLELDGKPLAHHCRIQLEPYCDGILFSVNSSNAENFAGFATAVDEVEGQGPLRGISAGLAASVTDINFVIACDIPFIDPSVLFTLLAHIDDYDMVIPSFAPGTYETLYGVYRKSMGPIAEELLGGGKRRISELFGRCRAKIVPMDDGGRYLNLNTKGEFDGYARARGAGRAKR